MGMLRCTAGREAGRRAAGRAWVGCPAAQGPEQGTPLSRPHSVAIPHPRLLQGHSTQQEAPQGPITSPAASATQEPPGRAAQSPQPHIPIQPGQQHPPDTGSHSGLLGGRTRSQHARVLGAAGACGQVPPGPPQRLAGVPEAAHSSPMPSPQHRAPQGVPPCRPNQAQGWAWSRRAGHGAVQPRAGREAGQPTAPPGAISYRGGFARNDPRRRQDPAVPSTERRGCAPTAEGGRGRRATLAGQPESTAQPGVTDTALLSSGPTAALCPLPAPGRHGEPSGHRRPPARASPGRGPSLPWAAHMNWDRLGTLMLMSPMLMLRGISGRLMFFTADTARDGAAERPPCWREGSGDRSAPRGSTQGPAHTGPSTRSTRSTYGPGACSPAPSLPGRAHTQNAASPRLGCC